MIPPTMGPRAKPAFWPILSRLNASSRFSGGTMSVAMILGIGLKRPVATRVSDNIKR